jgi:hypothetical protein
MTVNSGKRILPLRPAHYAIALIVLFYLVVGIGVLTGNWHSRVPYEEYQRLIPQVSSLGH